MRLSIANIAQIHDRMIAAAVLENAVRTQSMGWKPWANLSQAEQEYVIRLVDCSAEGMAAGAPTWTERVSMAYMTFGVELRKGETPPYSMAQETQAFNAALRAGFPELAPSDD